MAPRAGRASERERTTSVALPYRLDLLGNPYGPSLRVLEAIAARDDLHLPQDIEIERLVARVARMHSVPASWVCIGSGMLDLVYASIRLGNRTAVHFPPTDPDQIRVAAIAGVDVIEAPRVDGLAVEIDPARFDVPHDSVALVMSPNDPSGAILTPQNAVRIARACRFLVVDERHGAYSPRTLLPLVREFENIIVLRTFETWAGLNGFPIAYAIGPPRVVAAVNERRFHADIASSSVVAAHATLDDLRQVNLNIERIRGEKDRLYRTLRKLNMIRPYPSWANFVLTHVERGEADEYAAELHRRGFCVHRPCHPVLREHFRITATNIEATTALKQALIEIAAPL